MSDTYDSMEGSLPPEVKKSDISPTASPDKPWHRPRKQYIRKEHLGKAILGAINKAISQHKATINFMTIPGPELLDIQFVAETCKNKKIKLLYTGFINNSQESDIHLKNTRETALKGRFENIDSESTCYEHRFESIAHGDNRNMIEKTGPYHVCYIDVCGVLAKKSSSDLQGTVANGLQELLHYQCKNAANDWTLLLTFSAKPEMMSQEFNRELKSIVEIIAPENSEFNNRVAENKLNIDDAADTTLSIKIQALRVACFLYHIVKPEDRNWKALLENLFYYDPGKDKPCLVAMSMNFIRNPPSVNKPLSSNMNNSDSTNKEFTPKAYANAEVDIVEKVLAMKNVGDILRGCSTINEKMMESSKKLLKNAGFEVSNYEEWAKEQCSTN